MDAPRWVVLGGKYFFCLRSTVICCYKANQPTNYSLLGYAPLRLITAKRKCALFKTLKLFARKKSDGLQGTVSFLDAPLVESIQIYAYQTGKLCNYPNTTRGAGAEIE